MGRRERKAGLGKLLVSLSPSLLILACGAARADRIILAPSGLIVNPNSVKAEFAGMLSGERNNVGWLGVGLPGALNGLELEGETAESGHQRRSGFSAQYSLLGNAFTGIAPAVSVGMRDVLNSGHDGRSLFVAATKRFGLSQRQERVIRSWQATVGYGTNGLDGAFIGLQVALAPGVSLSAEYVSRRFNAAIGVPLVRNVSAKVYTLDGSTFYGVEVHLAR